MGLARARTRVGRAVLAAVAAAMSGCITHHHYYGQVPADATVLPNGAVCEVPSTGPGTLLSQPTPSRTTTVITAAPSPVVISSTPMGVRPFQRGASRFGWRNPEPMATTRAEGAIDDATTQ
jgi:hypothetical protein